MPNIGELSYGSKGLHSSLIFTNISLASKNLAFHIVVLHNVESQKLTLNIFILSLSFTCFPLHLTESEIMGRLPFSTKITIAVPNGCLQLLLKEFELKGAEIYIFFGGGIGGGASWNLSRPVYGLIEVLKNRSKVAKEKFR